VSAAGVRLDITNKRLSPSPRAVYAAVHARVLSISLKSMMTETAAATTLVQTTRLRQQAILIRVFY